MTNPPLVQNLGSLALWNCLVTQRQLLPWANERGVRCPLNKPRMPPSKETCSAPVFVAAGSCLPGIRLKFSLVTIKFLVKDYTWKELERPRRPGSQNETIQAEVQWTCSNCPVPILRSFTHFVVSLANPDYGGLHGGYWCR